MDKPSQIRILKDLMRMGETTQRAAETGMMEHINFGRNVLALHHDHQTFRAALQMPPLEEMSG
jgi:hypothetical protein